MAAVAKAGAFAAMLRVLFSSFGVVSTDWRPIVYGLAVLSLVLGAFVALRQRDVKRMLAYSSINHAGFILLGVVAGTARGVEASLYYLFAYMFMVIGSFAIVTVLGAPATATTICRATAAWPAASRCWPWRWPSCCWPRPAHPSPPACGPRCRWSSP